MIPTRRSFSHSDSKYHQKKQKNLFQFLVSSFGFSSMLSSLIIAAHDCSDMSELMSLFILDDEGKYAHVFVPDVNAPNPKCRACGEDKIHHVQQLTWQELIRFEQQLKKYESPLQFLEEQKFQVRSFSSDGQEYDRFRQNSEKTIWKQQAIQSFYKYSKVGIENKYQYVMCNICCGSFEKDDLVVINETMHQICLNCMAEYLKEQILNLRIQNMKCPHCPTLLTPSIIKQYTTSAMFQKYQTFSNNIQIQKNPNFKWCPNPKCSVVISINKGTKKTVKCPKCQTEVCTKCNRQAHPKKSCDEVINDVFKDLENAKDIQKCKKCKALVEKIAGCNHMTCGVCRYEWCWLCGATYSDIHFSPLNPIGCAGMQNRNMSGYPKCKIFVLRILMIIGFLILFPIVAPLALVFCGPVLLYNLFAKRLCYSYNCCFHIFIAIISLPLGLIADPFIWIGGLIYFLPHLCRWISNWAERRRNMRQASQNQIKRRLLEEGEDVVVSAS